MLGKIFDMSSKIFVCVLASFWYVRKIFFGSIPKTFFGDPPPPPARQHFGGEILMLSLSVQANYTEPPPQIRLGPYAHAYMIGPTQFRNMLNFIKIKGPLDYYKMW
jgi:hypothetical protein